MITSLYFTLTFNSGRRNCRRAIAFGLVCSLAERETKVEKSQLAFFQSINFKARLFRLVERERRVAADQINLKITHTQNQQFDVSGGVWWG